MGEYKVVIFTFYSYKGGVGRSMALANVAELFFQAGLRVLAVDFDLEAPGLEQFLSRGDPKKILNREGVIDLLLKYKSNMSRSSMIDTDSNRKEFMPHEPLEHYTVDLTPQPSERGQLWLLPAGKRSSDDKFANYVNEVLRFDWREFYEEWEGELYFEWLRKQFLSMADVVLIDSRTGVTEIGGVCTYQFADVVVMFCSASDQCLEGTYRVLCDLKRPQVEQLRGRPVEILVVPARVENAESDFLNKFQSDFLNCFGERIPKQLTNSEQLWNLRIPYIPRYAYKEIIAARERTKASAQDMVKAFNLLTFVLSRFAPVGHPLRSAFSETAISSDQGVLTVGTVPGGAVIFGEGGAAAGSGSLVVGGGDISTITITSPAESYEPAIRNAYLNWVMERCGYLSVANVDPKVVHRGRNQGSRI